MLPHQCFSGRKYQQRFCLVSRAIVKRDRSSDGTGSVGDPAVATEARQSTTGEAAEGNVADTTIETPAQTVTAETSADDHNAPAEAPVTTDAEVAEAAGSTAQSEEARETNPTPAEGESSRVDDADGGGEKDWNKDDIPKADEGELGLPFVATDITLVTCRAGEKVIGKAYFKLDWDKHVVAVETCLNKGTK